MHFETWNTKKNSHHTPENHPLESENPFLFDKENHLNQTFMTLGLRIIEKIAQIEKTSLQVSSYKLYEPKITEFSEDIFPTERLFQGLTEGLTPKQNRPNSWGGTQR